KPLRGSARGWSDRACRPGGRNRIVAAGLVKKQERGRPKGGAVPGGRQPEKAAHSRSARKTCSRTAYTCGLFLPAPAHRQRIFSDHRSDGARGWIFTRRYAPAKTRQARCSARTVFDLNPGRRTHCRDALAAERWSVSHPQTDTGAAPPKDAGGAYRANGDAVAAKAGADDLRGCAVGRPNQLGSVRSSCGPNSDT